jgi:hypothetical protein
MKSAVTVPVNIEPEAAEYIARLGYQEQFEPCLAKICELIPDLRDMEVKLTPDDEGSPEGGILITAFVGDYTPATRAAVGQYYDWQRRTFTFDVQDTFALLATAGGDHAGSGIPTARA